MYRYIQHDVQEWIEATTCDGCHAPAAEWVKPHRFGLVKVAGAWLRGELVGYLCPTCALEIERDLPTLCAMLDAFMALHPDQCVWERFILTLQTYDEDRTRYHEMQDRFAVDSGDILEWTSGRWQVAPVWVVRYDADGRRLGALTLAPNMAAAREYIGAREDIVATKDGGCHDGGWVRTQHEI